MCGIRTVYIILFCIVDVSDKINEFKAVLHECSSDHSGKINTVQQ